MHKGARRLPVPLINDSAAAVAGDRLSPRVGVDRGRAALGFGGCWKAGVLFLLPAEHRLTPLRGPGSALAALRSGEGAMGRDRGWSRGRGWVQGRDWGWERDRGRDWGRDRDGDRGRAWSAGAPQRPSVPPRGVPGKGRGASSIKHPASSIKRPAASILQPASNILQPASCIPLPAPGARALTARKDTGLASGTHGREPAGARGASGRGVTKS